MDIFALDVETRATDPNMSAYAALEPWRVRQGKAEISSIAVCYPDNEIVQIENKGIGWVKDVRKLLRDLKDQVVYAHFAVFDVAWLIATLERERGVRPPIEVRNVRWRDTKLLCKWIINGQKAEDLEFSYSLANLCKTFLPDHPRLSEFLGIKDQSVVPGENEEYWLSRGQLDVIMTRALAEVLQTYLPEEQRRGLLTEFSCIVPIANSWVNGIRVDVEEIPKVEDTIQSEMTKASKALGVEEAVLNSPKQLSNLLFTDWGLKPLTMNKTGPSVAKDDLMWIHYGLMKKGSEMALAMERVMTYKKHSTLKSKYVKTLKEALSHTGDGYIYGVPKMFGTYTGRMTYSNSTGKNGPKVSIALHQLPRAKTTKIANVAETVKMIRALLLPHEGFGLLEHDASGQESRLMALRSGDPMMLQVFQDEMNFHSMTGSAIIGMDYQEFQEKYKEQDENEGFGYFVEQRQLGKLTNLSCNFRIGGRALSEKAFTTYDTFLTEEMGRFLVNAFNRQYPGVPQYWSDVIRFAKVTGYTETFGKRRYKICKWTNDRDRWISESSAINVPIQGSAADMKYIGISILAKEFPDVFFTLDIHDAIFNFTSIEHIEETEKKVLDCLNSINYEKYWGFKPIIPLIYESKSGKSFGDVK